MIGLFRKIYNSISYKKNSRYPYASLYKALCELIGKRAYKTIIKNVPDRRAVLEEAARYLGTQEDNLLRAIAERMDMPVLYLPQPFNITNLPSDFKVTDLQRQGVLPILISGKVCGAVVCDPETLNNLPNLYQGSNIYLSTWSRISKALAESEIQYRRLKLVEFTAVESIAYNNPNADLQPELLRSAFNPKVISSSQINLTKKNSQIVLVEDNSTFSKILERYFSKIGLSLQIFSAAEMLLDKLNASGNWLPSMIIIDLQLPGLSGISLIRKLKQEYKLIDLPIVALTSDSRQEVEISALEAGADVFVTKIQDPRILLLHVKRLIELRNAA